MPPQPGWGGTGPGGYRSKLGGIPPRGRPQRIASGNDGPCDFYPKHAAGRPGWMPPAPTGPGEQRCSIVIIMRPTVAGGLCAPHRLFGRGLPGRQGTGSRPHAPPPRAARATVSRGRWPLTLLWPGHYGARYTSVSSPPCQSGGTWETSATSPERPMPLSPPRGSTFYWGPGPTPPLPEGYPEGSTAELSPGKRGV